MSLQSGPLGIGLLELADRLQLGISSFVSLGNKADVSANDFLNYWDDETHLANQAARLAAVDQNPGSGSLCAFIKGQGGFPSELKDKATVSVSYPDGTAVGGRAVATVSMPYSWLPIIRDHGGVASSTITGSATMRLERPIAKDGACSS